MSSKQSCGACSDATSPALIQLARTYRVISLLATCALLSSACSSSRARVADDREGLADRPPAEQKVDTRQLSSKEKLFLAIDQEFRARGWEIATTSERFSTIATGYESVSARMRKRRIGSIIFLPKGAALKVIVEYQRDAGPEGSPEWVVMEPKGKIGEAAGKEELEVARAIEKRFHNMR